MYLLYDSRNGELVDSELPVAELNRIDTGPVIDAGLRLARNYWTPGRLIQEIRYLDTGQMLPDVSGHTGMSTSTGHLSSV